MNENILHLALASLPAELLKDRFFNELCNTIPIEFKLLGKIEIEEGAFLAFNHINPELLKYFKPIKGKDNLLNLMLVYPNYLLTINIRREKNYYLIKYITNNGKEKMIITCKKEKNHTQVKMTTIKRKEGVITNYSSQIYDYDRNYRRIDNPNAIAEILKDFSNLFYIPFELSYYYYTKFQDYYQELHKVRIENEMKLDEATRPIKEIYTFIEPMSLINFKKSIYMYAGILSEHQQEKLSRIFNELETKIKEEYIVMSKNLFESIIKYIMGYTADMIFSHGAILTKEEKYYGFYHISITNEKIKISKELITEQMAQKIFHSSENNEESKLLKDFFGISPTR